jgi:hypothetical protein
MRHHYKAGRYLPRLRSARRSIHGTRTTTWVATALFIFVTSVCTTAMIIAIPGQAEATSQQIAQIWAHGSRVTTSPVPHLTPGDSVEVKVPKNSLLQAGFRADILMCGDPGAKPSRLPANDSTCDGLTINTGRTLDIETKGTVDKNGYVIYKLPLKIESPDSIPICNATHACVLYVGQDQNNFARPHVWSTAFYVGTGPKHK